MTTTTSQGMDDESRGVAIDPRDVCENNELFLLRFITKPLTKSSSKGKRNAPSVTTLHPTVISMNHCNAPKKAPQLSVLGIELNPFYVSVIHPEPCRNVWLCLASICPIRKFRPDIIRAALRVFVAQNCTQTGWTKAVSWFWKTMGSHKGKKAANGKEWVETGGLDFWVSLEHLLIKDPNKTDIPACNELIKWLKDLIEKNESLVSPKRPVLHATRIVDPGTLVPVFDDEHDNEYRLLCGLSAATTEKERNVIRCYEALFNDSMPLLYEPLDEKDRCAWECLVKLRIAKECEIHGRRFYYNPSSIVVPAVCGMCRPPRALVDAGSMQDGLLDLLARIMVHPLKEYFLVYDSSITPDSPDRRQLLSQWETVPRDLATIELVSNDDMRSITTTQCIRRVASRVYPKKNKIDDSVIGARKFKTVLLVDFAHWRLKQIVTLCTLFSIDRITSRAHAAWVIFNLTKPELNAFASPAKDPKEWTLDSSVASVLAWFDVTFIDK